MFADAEQEKAHNAKKRKQKLADRNKYDRNPENTTRRNITRVIQPWEETNLQELRYITKLRDIQDE